jgi:type II secretory pathway component PulM
MSAFANLRQAVGRAARLPVDYFHSWWERTAPRTRKLVVGLAITCVSMLVLSIATVTFSSISSLEEENGQIREALAEITKHHDEYLDAKTRNAVQEARIGNDPPQLTADLEAAARGENVQIAESSERPVQPAGASHRFLQHDVDIKLREVDLQSLTKFMRRVETGPRFIFFTRISLKHRYSETDKLDAELTATSFEKVKDDKKKKAEGTKPAGKKE